MKRRIRPILLCLLALIFILGGCRGTEQSQETVPAASQAQEAETPDSPEVSLSVQPETTYHYETQELYAQRGDNQIYGVIYVPQNAAEKMPTVIFLMALEERTLWAHSMRRP